MLIRAPSVWAYDSVFFAELYAFLVYESTENLYRRLLCISFAAEIGSDFMKKVAIIMGSDSDLPIVEKAFAVLREYGVPFEAHVMSAHRTPEAVNSFVGSARENGFGVIIACAGMAAHLAGVCAAATTLPVIGVPCKGGMLDGLDALLATVQMPTGIPVATVAMNGAANAALLACEMIALSDDELTEKLNKARRDGAEKVYAKDAALQEKI